MDFLENLHFLACGKKLSHSAPFRLKIQPFPKPIRRISQFSARSLFLLQSGIICHLCTELNVKTKTQHYRLFVLVPFGRRRFDRGGCGIEFVAYRIKHSLAKRASIPFLPLCHNTLYVYVCIPSNSGGPYSYISLTNTFLPMGVCSVSKRNEYSLWCSRRSV